MTREEIMQQIIQKQDELIIRKCKHSPNCWINQNWDEARMAMADTPSNFKDASYYEALKEIERKSQTCSCGLVNLQSELADLKAKLEESEDEHEFKGSYPLNGKDYGICGDEGEYFRDEDGSVSYR